MGQTLEGGCRCGAVRYKVSGTPAHVALCHCADCRKSSGAPMVVWAAFAENDVTLLSGALSDYRSSPPVTRRFCTVCGTGLFYSNPEVLPGLIDVQAATLDDPDALPPQAQIQTAERLGWMETIDSLPAFARFPGE
jgi:Uncharacterized conserved protein